jgi:accessory gene regulator B
MRLVTIISLHLIEGRSIYEHKKEHRQQICGNGCQGTNKCTEGRCKLDGMLFGIPAKSTEGTVTFQETEIMEYISRVLSEWLAQQNVIEPSDRGLYEYAMYSFLVSVMPLVIFMIASGIVGMLPEGLLIIIPFMVIRKFSGGYHAKHAYICMTISLGLLVSSFYVVIHSECGWFFHMLVVISGASVIINSPIDSENKKLEEDEIDQYKRTTCMLVTMTIVLYSVLILLNQRHYAVCLAVSLVLTAILQLPCIVIKRKF